MDTLSIAVRGNYRCGRRRSTLRNSCSSFARTILPAARPAPGFWRRPSSGDSAVPNRKTGPVHNIPGARGSTDAVPQSSKDWHLRHLAGAQSPLAETINGLFKAEVIHRRGPWRSLEAVEFATIPPAEAEQRYYAMLTLPAMAA